MTTLRIAAALALSVCAISAQAQMTTEPPAAVAGAKPVTVERIKVHSAALENNLEGDSADRDVLVILPPGYATSGARRYPVIYALHGYSVGAEQWSQEIHAVEATTGAFARGVQPMIVVLPDSKTMHNGSMYSSSVTTGDHERFISHDLIAAIDAKYRTLPVRESRGLVGHSMGGYGASRIGMKHADMFGALYMMSPCCLSPRALARFDAKDEAALTSLTSPTQSERLSWGQRATLATAAAWSPNPAKAPLFLDLPVENGQPREDIAAKWTANSPLAFVDQYVGNLRRYRAIAIDVGSKDGLKDDAGKLHAVLDRYGIANSFQIYDGDHTNRIAVRFQDQVMPFFGRALAAGRAPKR